jgi:transcriptional regulator with XRE-family HTH domain
LAAGPVPNTSGVTDIGKLVGNRVREFRTSHRLTQEQLGERAGLSYKFIGEVERGVGNPTIQTLADIAAALGVPVVDLVTTDRLEVSIGHFSATDVAVVREARDSLEVVLRRLSSPRRGKRSKRQAR